MPILKSVGYIEVRSTIDTHYKIIRNNIMALRMCDDFCLNNKRLGNTQFAVVFCFFLCLAKRQGSLASQTLR